MSTPLTPADKRTLLTLARQALRAAATGSRLPSLKWAELAPELQEARAAFVTLTLQGELRGCIGGLQATAPLAEEVQKRTLQAALEDYRFPPVRPEEVNTIEIEVSVLTEPQALTYTQAAELPQRLRPHVDGVTLSLGRRRATFLPQVWEKIPDPELFLGLLCQKMGVGPDSWRQGTMTVETYQVDPFTEAEFPEPGP